MATVRDNGVISLTAPEVVEGFNTYYNALLLRLKLPTKKKGISPEKHQKAVEAVEDKRIQDFASYIYNQATTNSGGPIFYPDNGTTKSFSSYTSTVNPSISPLFQLASTSLWTRNTTPSTNSSAARMIKFLHSCSRFCARSQ